MTQDGNHDGMRPADAIAVRIKQGAKLIGVGRSTFYKLINAGEIETIKVGRTRLILTKSLHDFLARHRLS